MGRAVLYAEGLFTRNLPDVNAAHLAAIQSSGFDTVVLWTLQPDSDGTLVYGNSPIAQDEVFANTFNYLAPLVEALKAPTSTVKTVLFSIGAGGSATYVPQDWTYIQALVSNPATYQALHRNFNALTTQLAIDGFDFDDEDLISPGADATTVAMVTSMLSNGGANVITYCPCYPSQDFWTECLSNVYASANKQLVNWMNLQVYGGANVSDFVDAIDQSSNPTGVQDAKAFMVPGYNVSTTPPTELQKTLAKMKGLGGAFIWNSAAFFNGSTTFTLNDYAKAIRNGLAGIAP